MYELPTPTLTPVQAVRVWRRHPGADFNSADLPMLMRIADLPPRYRRHLLGA